MKRWLVGSVIAAAVASATAGTAKADPLPPLDELVWQCEGLGQTLFDTNGNSRIVFDDRGTRFEVVEIVIRDGIDFVSRKIYGSVKDWANRPEALTCAAGPSNQYTLTIVRTDPPPLIE